MFEADLFFQCLWQIEMLNGLSRPPPIGVGVPNDVCPHKPSQYIQVKSSVQQKKKAGGPSPPWREAESVCVCVCTYRSDLMYILVIGW